MSDFRETDVKVISLKLQDGRREIGLVHLPTGLSVGDYVNPDESSLKCKERLLVELRKKVVNEQ
jgi:hypothetical protein